MENTINLINKDLNNISEYSSKNCLRINPNKSLYMIIGSRKNIVSVNSKTYPPILINGTAVERHHVAKNLGVTFDEVLAWREHINNLIGKAYNKLKYLY